MVYMFYLHLISQMFILKLLGFWAAYPGEHLSVFSRESLREPILNSCGLYIFKETHESVTLDLENTWFSWS